MHNNCSHDNDWAATDKCDIVCVITGGTSGVGKATVELLLKLKVTVIVGKLVLKQ